MKGRAIVYSADELAWLAERREWPRAVLQNTFSMLFDRPDVSLVHISSLCKRKGWTTGRTGYFVKGQEPTNKGRVCPPGVGGRHPNARRTQYKKGNLTGTAARNYQPIGTERLSLDGYWERKIHDGMPLQSRWRLVHLLKWEALNGPLPKGHCLKSLDGDRANTDPANWKLIPRAMLPALNGGRHKRRPAYDTAAPELRPSLLAMAEVETRARRLKRSK